MPDPVQLALVLTAAAAASAAVALWFAWPTPNPRPGRASLGWVLGVAAGFYLGGGLLGLRPSLPPREDQDRLALVLFPAVVAVELAAALWPRRGWLAWPLRLAVAAAAAAVLLHGTTYLADLAGPDSREWTASQARTNLAALGVALAAVWAALAGLARRSPGRGVPLALAIDAVGAGAAVMLSGYASGGQLGFPLAGALLGATAASLAPAGRPEVSGAVGPGVVGLFAVVLAGVFFGTLQPVWAGLLFLAPLLCWLPEGPYARGLPPWLRGLAGPALVAVVVAAAVVQARARFIDESAQPAAPAMPAMPDPDDPFPAAP